MVSRPASPSTSLSRVAVATTPSKPSAILRYLARALRLSILIVESMLDAGRLVLPDCKAGGRRPRRHTGDAVRVREPRPIAVGSETGPAEGTPLLPGGRRTPATAERGAAGSERGCRTGTALGRPGARVGHHAHQRRQVLLSRSRCGAARGDSECGARRRAVVGGGRDGTGAAVRATLSSVSSSAGAASGV